MVVRVPLQEFMLIEAHGGELLPSIEEWFTCNGFREGVDWWFDFDFHRLSQDWLVFKKRRVAQLFHLTWCIFPL